MPHTYNAVLRGDRLEWIDCAPAERGATPVRITLLEESPIRSGEKCGRAMAEALEAIAEIGGCAAIADPSSWQREVRRDRGLPGRDV